MRRSTVSSRSVWKIGCVMMSSAPASRFFSRRASSFSRTPPAPPLLLGGGELLVEIRRTRLEARREEERRLTAGQRLAGGIHAAVHIRRHLQQPDRVEVVDRGRFRVVADLRRVARDDY